MVQASLNRSKTGYFCPDFECLVFGSPLYTQPSIHNSFVTTQKCLTLNKFTAGYVYLGHPRSVCYLAALLLIHLSFGLASRQLTNNNNKNSGPSVF